MVKKISCPLVLMISEYRMGTNGSVFQKNILDSRIFCFVLQIIVNCWHNHCATKCQKEEIFCALIHFHIFFLNFIYCPLNTCLNSFLFHECSVHFISLIGPSHLLPVFPIWRKSLGLIDFVHFFFILFWEGKSTLLNLYFLRFKFSYL